MSNLTVISSTLVPMATNNTTTSISRTELTPWDLHFLHVYPIQKGLLFHKPDDLERSTTTVEHLKAAFARALDFFPPLAGRLGATPNDDGTTSYFVDCNNAGAEFTHVFCPLSVADISQPKYIPEIVSASFFPLNEVRNVEGVSNPLLGVQITELADGFFIGCSANHGVVDGTSFWHFLNSWAEISRGADTISLTPVFNRDFPDGNRVIPIPTVDVSALPKPELPPLLERVFTFSKESLSTLKSKANDEAGSEKISSLQALLAHLWRRLGHARRGSDDDRKSDRETCMVLPIGARSRIPLPEGYFGNAISVSYLGMTEAELLDCGIGQTALKINAFVARLTTRSAVFGFIEDWVKNRTMVKVHFDFLVSSTPRHDVYGCDFGWGRPIAVRSGKAQKRDGKMTVFPAAETGGIDIEVCLAPETLRALEGDIEFMETVTTL